jgi:hypothetical protein
VELKSNSLRPIDLHDFVSLKNIRKFIERAFSVIPRLLPRRTHAVTPEDFEIKALGFLVVTAIDFIINELFKLIIKYHQSSFYYTTIYNLI